MKFAVVVFPGSNCDLDLYWAVKEIMGADCEYVPHTATSLAGFDGVLLPGIFLWRLSSLWSDCPLCQYYARSDSVC